MELRDRIDREAEYRRKLNSLSKDHRQELVELAGNPPNLANVPASFWVKVESEQATLLFLLFSQVFFDNATLHGARPQQADVTARTFAQNNSEKVSRSYATNSIATLASIDVTKLTPWSFRKFIKDRVFGPKRDENLLSTEFTRASAGGAEFGADQIDILSEHDTWITHPELTESGPCKICAPYHNKPRKVWVTKFPLGPPAHPRCVCEVAYAMAEEVGLTGELT